MNHAAYSLVNGETIEPGEFYIDIDMMDSDIDWEIVLEDYF